MNKHTIDVSISIVNWNTRDLLRQCIKSIVSATHGVRYEIIVVDNNSTDRSLEMVKREFPEVTVIGNKENRRFAAGNNQAITISGGEFILLLNPDIIVLPDAILSMVKYIRSHSAIGAVGCKLLNKDGSVQEKGFFRKFPSLPQVLLFYTVLQKVFLSVGFLRKKYWEDITSEDGCQIDQTPGACTLIRRSVLEQIGYMDEGFYLFFEDVDMCYRIKKAGWNLYYFTEAEMIHYGMQSFTSWNGLDIHIRFHSSLLLFFKKHHGMAHVFTAYLIICINELIKNIVKIVICPFYDLRSRKKRTIKESVYFLSSLAKIF